MGDPPTALVRPERSDSRRKTGKRPRHRVTLDRDNSETTRSSPGTAASSTPLRFSSIRMVVLVLCHPPTSASACLSSPLHRIIAGESADCDTRVEAEVKDNICRRKEAGKLRGNVGQ